MAKSCVASVKNSSSDYELIIVDNGSTERFNWEDYCDVYIRFNKNMGISHGWNAILNNARGEYITILGDDTIVHEGYLECMLAGFENKDCGMCNPHVEHLPAGMGVVENYKWPSGACFMLSKETVKKVGPFAEHLYFPAQFEDTDYWTRIYKAGLKLYVNYSLTVQHEEGQTDKAPDISVHFDKNKERYLAEHGFDPIPVFYGEAQMPKFG